MEVILSAGVQSEEAFLHPQTQAYLQALEKGMKNRPHNEPQSVRKK